MDDPVHLKIGDTLPTTTPQPVGPVLFSALQASGGKLTHRPLPVAGISGRLPLASRKAEFIAAMTGLTVEDDAKHPFAKQHTALHMWISSTQTFHVQAQQYCKTSTISAAYYRITVIVDSSGKSYVQPNGAILPITAPTGTQLTVTVTGITSTFSFTDYNYQTTVVPFWEFAVASLTTTIILVPNNNGNLYIVPGPPITGMNTAVGLGGVTGYSSYAQTYIAVKDVVSTAVTMVAVSYQSQTGIGGSGSGNAILLHVADPTTTQAATIDFFSAYYGNIAQETIETKAVPFTISICGVAEASGPVTTLNFADPGTVTPGPAYNGRVTDFF